MTEDPAVTGRPSWFDVEKFLEVVRMFVSADEVKTALWLLDNMPGFYRDHIPYKALELKREILSQIVTIEDYQSYTGECYEENLQKEKANYDGIMEFNDLGDFFNAPFCYPRSEILLGVVQGCNEAGKTPHLVELGPSNYWVCHGLSKKGCQFTYEPITVNQNAKNDQLPRLKEYRETTPEGSPQIFICFEVLEHLWHENDIVHYFHRKKLDPEFILLSTPRYTMLGGNDPHKPRTIEHLRTWTPKEFNDFARKSFPNYNWLYYDSAMMVLRGIKNK